MIAIEPAHHIAPVTDDALEAARTRLLHELALERFAPVLPVSPKRHQRARQASAPERPTRKPTGTGWPE